MDARVAALTASYRLIAERDMAGVPICNAALAVEALGFRPHGPGWIGCVIAPWFLNAVLIPRDPALWADRRDGDKVQIGLPSGAYRFTAARVGVLGTLAVIPLASAMNVFTDQEDTRAAAVLALDHLMREPKQPTQQAEPPPASDADAMRPALSRRSLFGRTRR
nr:[NiFe]-hydrogenase assembly chaperone HybE [Azospirillum formosense]